MPRPASAILILAIAGCAHGPAARQPVRPVPLRPTNPVEFQIRALEHERRGAILRNDTETLDSLLAPTLITVTASGAAVGKAEELAVNRNSARRVLEWEFEDLEIRVYGDAAVSTMRVRFRDVLGARERTEHQRLTHVWAKIDLRYQLIARHATRITP